MNRACLTVVILGVFQFGGHNGLRPQSAHAEPPVRVVVIDAPSPSSTTARIEDAVWAAREEVGKVSSELVGPDLPTTLVGEGEAPADADWGRAQLKAARAAYGELEVERAAQLADGAARALAHAGATAEAVEALMLAAEAFEAGKDKASTARSLRALLTLSPDFKPKKGALRPSLARALDGARRNRRGTGSLRLEATPNAQVKVNGGVVGVTPRLLEAVTAGVYAVGFESDGFVREIRWIDVPEAGSRAVSAALSPLRKQVLWAQIRTRLPAQIESPDVQDGLRDLKSLVFADQAIVLQARPASTVGALFDLRAGRRVRIVQVQAAGDEAGRALVRALYDGLDPRTPGLEAPPEEEQPGAALHTRWWFWPAIVVGAAAAVTIPVLLLSEDPPEGLRSRDNAGAVILRF